MFSTWRIIFWIDFQFSESEINTPENIIYSHDNYRDQKTSFVIFSKRGIMNLVGWRNNDLRPIRKKVTMFSTLEISIGSVNFSSLLSKWANTWASVWNATASFGMMSANFDARRIDPCMKHDLSKCVCSVTWASYSGCASGAKWNMNDELGKF